MSAEFSRRVARRNGGVHPWGKTHLATRQEAICRIAHPKLSAIGQNAGTGTAKHCGGVCGVFSRFDFARKRVPAGRRSRGGTHD